MGINLTHLDILTDYGILHQPDFGNKRSDFMRIAMQGSLFCDRMDEPICPSHVFGIDSYDRNAFTAG